MEKVIMLSRLPGMKNVIFTRRIILFQETFAPLGGTPNEQKKPIGAIWHEGITGRCDEDLARTYTKVINHIDCQHFVFWANNCSAQNKNWTLFSALIYELNQPGNCQSVTINYFEKGHTFMAADAFRKTVEDEMRSMKYMDDFSDFEKAINAKRSAVFASHSDELFEGIEQSQKNIQATPNWKTYVSLDLNMGPAKFNGKQK